MAIQLLTIQFGIRRSHCLHPLPLPLHLPTPNFIPLSSKVLEMEAAKSPVAAILDLLGVKD
jgi:hypothetical protein